MHRMIPYNGNKVGMQHKPPNNIWQIYFSFGLDSWKIWKVHWTIRIYNTLKQGHSATASHNEVL